MTSSEARAILEGRVRHKRRGLLDVHTRLVHFALVNYALPSERLARHIPTDRFAIPEFPIGGRSLALMSAVPFVDVDFHYRNFLPFLRFDFAQTNYRAYVVDRKTGEHAAWFFGTTLGSPVVHAARTVWRIPWHYARYRVDCEYDAASRRYARYDYEARSSWGHARVVLEDTGAPIANVEGFASYDEMKLVLTHPVTGYYHRTDGKLGTYAIWHPEMPLTIARGLELEFGLYERLGLLTRAEMAAPHSVFLCPEIEFEVYLPPRRVR